MRQTIESKYLFYQRLDTQWVKLNITRIEKLQVKKQYKSYQVRMKNNYNVEIKMIWSRY